MKKIPVVTALFAAMALAMSGKKLVVEPSTAWSVMQPLGLHQEATIDTLMLDYSRTSIPSEVTDAWATTGNYGAEGLNMIFLDRPAMSDFFFRDAIDNWLPSSPEKLRFYNTRIPMSLVGYTSSGGRETAQERLSATFSGNINRRAQVGAMLDYIYSKGSYSNQAVKDLIWGVSGSYMGDRYEFQGAYSHYNNVNKENGGITDMMYITDPAQLQGGITTIDPKSIPTNLQDAHTRISGNELWINNRYKVGYWHEEAIDDTTTRRTYIPVSSFIHTLEFKTARHGFNDGKPDETREFFSNTYLDPTITRDRTSYWSVSNTLGVSMLEGFHKYAKFGLAAYITHEARHYSQTADTLDHSDETLGLDPFPEGRNAIVPDVTQQLLSIGGQLTKQKGSILTYDATAEFGIVGPVAGDVRIEGNVATRFKLLGDTVTIAANGFFRNQEAPYLTNNYLSNHFIWHNDFGKERTYRVGGILNIPHTGTRLEAGIVNLQNHIYFGEDYLPHQHGANVQVFSARLNQQLRLGILHWDNTVTYQTSTDDQVIPLPKLAVYSNLYILFRIATLHVQLGVDCDYYTRYYAPRYQPATNTFANQHGMLIGNYPFINAYANMKLSKVRFFVLFSHVNQGLCGTSYFSMPNYPLNPRRFQIGLSVDFAN